MGCGRVRFAPQSGYPVLVRDGETHSMSDQKYCRSGAALPVGIGHYAALIHFLQSTQIGKVIIYVVFIFCALIHNIS